MAYLCAITAANADDIIVATTTVRDDPKKWLTYEALQKKMPNDEILYNDLTQMSNKQSKKLYHKKMIINKSLKLKSIKPADAVFLHCYYGHCTNNKRRNETFKATQFAAKHCDKAHKGVELKEEYFKVFDVWKVDCEKKIYLQQYIQLSIIDKYKALPTDDVWSLKSLQISLQTLLHM